MARRVKAVAPYWVWLNVVALELGALLIFAAALIVASPFAWGAAAFSREAAATAQTAVWLTLPVAFLFGAHLRPYRWFWLALVGIAVAATLLSFFGYVRPLGDLSVRLAAALGVDRASGPLAGPPSWVAAAPLLWVVGICAILVVHIRQLARTPADAPYGIGYAWWGVALLLAYAAFIGLRLWGTHGFLFEPPPVEIGLSRDASPPPLSPASPGNAPAARSPSVQSNPLTTPAHILPEWYALPFYAILRALPDKLLGVVAMGAALGVWALIPWLDQGRAAPFWRRARIRWIAPAILGVLVALGVLGAAAPTDGALWAARALTLAYFALILAALPWAARTRSDDAKSAT